MIYCETCGADLLSCKAHEMSTEDPENKRPLPITLTCEQWDKLRGSNEWWQLTRKLLYEETMTKEQVVDEGAILGPP